MYRKIYVKNILSKIYIEKNWKFSRHIFKTSNSKKDGTFLKKHIN